MNNAVIAQEGNPKDLYNFPKNKFVANFIGDANVVKAEIISKPAIESDDNQKLDSISIIYSFPEYQSICLKAFKIFFCKRVIFLNTLYYLFI